MIDERSILHPAHVDQAVSPAVQSLEDMLVPDLGNLSGYLMGKNPSLSARNLL